MGQRMEGGAVIQEEGGEGGGGAGAVSITTIPTKCKEL